MLKLLNRDGCVMLSCKIDVAFAKRLKLNYAIFLNKIISWSIIFFLCLQIGFLCGNSDGDKMLMLCSDLLKV